MREITLEAVKLLIMILALVITRYVVPWIKARFPGKRRERQLSLAALLLLTALMAVSVVFLVGQSYNPFIYFKF